MTYEEHLNMLLDLVDAIKMNAQRRGDMPSATDINSELWACVQPVTRQYRPIFEEPVLSYIHSGKRPSRPATKGHSKPHGTMGYDIVGENKAG